MQQLSPENLKSRLEETAVPVLLDVREAWEYDICRIRGSINISMGDIPDALGKLEPGKETVVICHHGMRSMQVAAYLEAQGFTAIANLEGGIAAWANSVDQSMPQY